jgi:hypothetical protein
VKVGLTGFVASLVNTIYGFPGLVNLWGDAEAYSEQERAGDERKK